MARSPSPNKEVKGQARDARGRSFRFPFISPGWPEGPGFLGFSGKSESSWIGRNRDSLSYVGQTNTVAWLDRFAPGRLRAKKTASLAGLLGLTISGLAAGESSPLAGIAIEQPAYLLSLSAPGQAGLKEPLGFSVELETKAGHKVNHEYPLKLKLESAADWESPRVEWTAADAAMASAHLAFQGKVVARRSGTIPLRFKLSFSVCTDSTCLVEKKELEASVVVR